MIGNKTLKIMQDVAKGKPTEKTDLIFGEVTSIDPLKIKVDNRFEITETFIIVSKLCKSFKIDLSHSHIIPNATTNETDNHSHTIDQSNTQTLNFQLELWGDLQVGDIVRMLRVADGNRYYVIEKEE